MQPTANLRAAADVAPKHTPFTAGTLMKSRSKKRLLPYEMIAKACWAQVSDAESLISLYLCYSIFSEFTSRIVVAMLFIKNVFLSRTCTFRFSSKQSFTDLHNLCFVHVALLVAPTFQRARKNQQHLSPQPPPNSLSSKLRLALRFVLAP